MSLPRDYLADMLAAESRRIEGRIVRPDFVVSRAEWSGALDDYYRWCRPCGVEHRGPVNARCEHTGGPLPAALTD